MIFVSMVGLVLTLCLAFVYLRLACRFFKVKAALPALKLKDGLGRLAGTRVRLAALGTLFFLAWFVSQLSVKLWAPDMLLVFNYEEAARGQNPNVTRFNESGILSESILEQVIQRGALELTAQELAGLLAISTPLDAEKLDGEQESSLKISTEYWIHCSERAALYHIQPRTVLSLLADVYWEDFVRSYGENDSVLDLSFDELEGMEYLDVKDFLEMQAYKLKNYLPTYSSQSSSFRAADGGETFASLSRKIDNFVEIELERYKAFVLENGLSLNRGTYQARMQFANRLLDTERMKDMAAHDVRIEAIDMYNAYMTRFVLIPTYDVDREFYMSKTKVGVDYFADEAKEHLESAAGLLEEMEHNAYASAQVGGGRGSSEVRAQADRRVQELKEELNGLSAQCRELCAAYVRERRDGYIQVGFSQVPVLREAAGALVMTALFAAPLGGLYILEPFYREYLDSRPPRFGRRKWRGRRDKGGSAA